ncbi:MAG: 23S rRNA (uracil(1939)-C(5))-methyltransferase RlmD [Bacteroidales bacterium]|nr:23S rRNA (uracil(1939)-C(5))-methyltransferase RlmD [Bacteroidales bacterium]
MMKKKKEPEYLNDVLIVDAGSEGMSVAKPEGRVVFIPFGVPGDIVDIEVFKKKKNYFEGRILRFKKYSDKRVDPVCQHFGLCGGCKWQHLGYEWQLYYKQKQVKDNFDRIGKIDYPGTQPILGCERQYFYRNKLEYAFSNRKWLTDGAPSGTYGEDEVKGLGFHLPSLFDRVVDVERCHLQADPSNDIRLFVRQFTMDHGLSYYSVRHHEGLMRNLVIRCNSKGEFMVILVISEENAVVRNELIPALESQFPQIVSLLLIINNKLNDVINDLPFECLKGDPYLIETMASPRPGFPDLKFRIGPVSFFQTNVYQAERLYHAAFDLANVKGDELMYDLYTGTGTIAQYFSRFVRRVVGIEYVEEAIADAKVNASINGIDNCTFYAGDMAKIFTDEFIEANGKPDFIVTDPPRAGMAEKVVDQLLKIRASKIVYVSCNPATQARDLQRLCESYQVKAVQPVDMFPHTQHVENITLLELKPEE